ncbi:MAG: TrkA family potassium uptake protein [Wenzhouxiangella sp.]|jgi:trk system potassium uptake protein TrkA|nr:TrkA family potassium uptake protein [Wenzhouxiangella sp.]
MSHKRRKFVVIGLDILGSTVARELARFGNHVLGISNDEHSVGDIADALSEAVIADARDADALREIGVHHYDVAIVAIKNLEASILAAMNVKLLGVPKVWAKAINPVHHSILERLEVDRVIHPEQEVGQHIAQMLHNPQVRDYIQVGDDLQVVDFAVPEKLAGQPLAELNLAERLAIRCLGVIRDAEYLDADNPSLRLQAEDKLLLLGHRRSLREFTDSL